MDQNVLEQSENTELRRAGFWHRVAALIIDMMVLSAIGFAINFAFQGPDMFANMMDPSAQAERMGLEQPNTNDPGEQFNFALQSQIRAYVLPETWIGVFLFLFYFAWFESSKGGATLGKMALGLKVVDENGGQISRSQGIQRAGMRFVLHGLNTMFCCLTAFSYLTAAGSSKKSPLDMVAGTFVVFK